MKHSDYIFPIIHGKNVMQEALSHKKEVRFAELPDGCTVVCVMIADSTTYDSPMSREARGLVFDETGMVAARPLHKFFNMNERESTQLHNVDWSKVARVMLKRDGSMIHTVGVNDPDRPGRFFRLKSKKSFVSDVMREVHSFLDGHEHQDRYVSLCNHLVSLNKTAIFEYTAPTSRIVLYYDEPSLQLLHVRDNVTGQYMNEAELQVLCGDFGVPLVFSDNEVKFLLRSDPKAINHLCLTAEKTEGWVVQFDDGEMLKIKTKWYMDRHHAMTFLRKRDIARMVVEESIDDLKAKLSSDGVLVDQIEEVEREVVADLLEIETEINAQVMNHAGKKRVDVVNALQGHRYFGLIMRAYGRAYPDEKHEQHEQIDEQQQLEEDVKKHFVKYRLQNYTLEQINLIDSTAEAE